MIISMRDGVFALLYLRSTLTQQDARRLGSFMRATKGEPVAAMATLAHEDLPPPPAEFRREVARQLRDARFDGLSVVIPGSGFVHAFHVAVNTGILMLAGGLSYPARAHRNVEEGALWLEKQTRVASSRVIEDMTLIRQALDERRVS